MRKFLSKSIVYLSLTIFLIIVTISVSFSWFIHLYNLENPVLGKTHSHFAAGDGTQLNPYLITKPEHFTSLAYLQNSGYFNKDNITFYFSIPQNIEINFSNSIYRTIPPIGTKTYPFVSVLEGNKSVLKGYIVDGKNNQDIGTFGYVGTGAIITNLFLHSPTIISEPASDIISTNFHAHNELNKNIATGYVAGHVAENVNISNVFVVSPNIISTNNAYSNRSQYGLIGYSDSNLGEIAGGPRDQKYSFTLDTAIAAQKIYNTVQLYGDTYYVYKDGVATNTKLNQAITAPYGDVTINTGYSLSTLVVINKFDANPTPIYFYDLLVQSQGEIGTGDNKYVKENIDLIGTQLFVKSELNMNLLNFKVPKINDTWDPLLYSTGLIIYVRPTNNPNNLGTMTTIKANNSGNLTFKLGWSGSTYLGGTVNDTAGTSFFTSPLIMTTSNAFTAIKTINGVTQVVNPTVVSPDYYVFLIGADSNGKLKITSINFNYVPPKIDELGLQDISQIDFIDENSIATLQQDSSTHTFSYVNFGYDLLPTQKINNISVTNVGGIFKIYFSYQISDASSFYIDIINIKKKTIQVYLGASEVPIYNGTDDTIELFVEATKVTATGRSPTVP